MPCPMTAAMPLVLLATTNELPRALVSAVEAAHPDLRDRFRTEMAATLEEDEEDSDGEDTRDFLVEQLWPAAICYAVTAATHFRGRPGAHSPWDLLDDGFEEGTLADHFWTPAPSGPCSRCRSVCRSSPKSLTVSGQDTAPLRRPCKARL